jgi:16S rRNA (cytosine967-C5)-methyltransferase
MGHSSRESAALILTCWLQTKELATKLLPEDGQRAFVQDLVYTTIRRLRPLRMVLGELVKKWPKGEMEALLYLGAAQILYMDDVPDFAAVSETVNAAKACENPSIAKVVNGVLRNVIRRRGEFEKMIRESALEVRESFPSVLVRRWKARFGEEKTAALCAYHNMPAETFLAYGDRFEKLARGKRVQDVEGYEAGEFIVQDPATGIAVEAMDVKEGERVLDACAAPGGKAIQLAWRGADVTACEVSRVRRAKLVENLKRVKLEGKVEVVEALVGLRGSFEKVLVDAPCSNTGVLRRRPDARWNWTEEKLGELVRLQAEILDKAAAVVGPGGRLVYSTCSNEPEENEGQVAAFLKRHEDFELVGSRESLPFETGFDGAFAAVLQKK